MNSRFALLDVIKSQKTSKGKGAEDTLKLTNELKIITAPDDVFNSGLCNLRFLKIYAQINKLTPSDVHKLSPLVLY